MGVNASVICIGKFRREIAEMLEYPLGYYDETRAGVIVCREMFHCLTNESSVELAQALGVRLWDFNTHEVKQENISWEQLYELFEEEKEDVDEFKILVSDGFQCIFKPNG